MSCFAWLETARECKCLASPQNNETNGERDASTDCSQIMSMTITGADESSGLMTFESEACERVDVLGSHYFKPKVAPIQSDLQDLTRYFERPILIYSAAVTSSQNVVFTQPIDTDYLFSTVFPNGYTRLTGVFGVRFKLCFTIQIAATPYHQGVLVSSFQYGNSTRVTGQGLTPRGIVTGMQTNLPHVRMDVSTTTMTSLEVPYLATHEFMTLNEQQVWDYGVFSISPLLPVTPGTGTAAPTIRVYLHLADLELLGATSVGQTAVVLQSGKQLSPVTEEFNRESHPFSSALNSAGQTFNFIAKGIPSLASLAGPPAWFLGQAARLARFYGFSKPAIVEPTTRMLIQSHINESNVDVAAAASLVGPFQGNTLAVSPEFGHTAVDEMSLPFILSQYSQLCIGQVATTNAAGTVLWASQVSPSSFWFRSRLTGNPPFCNISAPEFSGVAGNRIGFIPTNIFYIASCFKQWKGSFRVRVTFGKTKFHGGRVLMSYYPNPGLEQQLPTNTPGQAYAPAVSTYGPTPFGYTKLFDLRDSNEFEFDIPYIAALPYQSFFNSSGSITMVVADPLQAPSTVPSAVPFLVEVMALPDFEVAIPLSPLYPPTNVVSGASTNIRYQSGKLMTMARPVDSQLAVGESVASVKQLVSIPKFSYGGNILANTIKNIYLFPWWFGNITGVGANVNGYARETFGFGYYFSQAYTFVRGSTDYHFYGTNALDHDNMFLVSLVGPDPDTSVNPPVNSPRNRPTSNAARVVQNSTDVGTHVRLPAYQRTFRMLTDYFQTIPLWYPEFGLATSIVKYPFNYYNPLAQFQAAVVNTSTQATQIRLSRNAGDDAALSMYIGPPVLTLLPADNISGVYDPDTLALIGTNQPALLTTLPTIEESIEV